MAMAMGPSSPATNDAATVTAPSPTPAVQAGCLRHWLLRAEGKDPIVQ